MISEERLRLDRAKKRHSLADFSGLGAGKAKPYRSVRRPSRGSFVSFAVLILVFCWGCNPSTRRNGMPAGAQTALDSVIADIDAGQDEKLYGEAADEWRRESTLDQSRATFATLREKLGKVHVRNLQGVNEEQTGTAHSVFVAYQTSFDRSDAMETFTLVEHGGRWQLARYYVTSTALK